jgi:3-oxoadipate enol-lactonase
MGMRCRWQYVGPSDRRGRLLSIGNGLDVVLLASPLARGETYLPTALTLARRFRVHLVEFPGSGASSRVARPWDVLDHEEWVADLLLRRALAKCIVIGHSYSGMVVIALAAHRPDMLRALIVADTAGMREPPSLAIGIRGAVTDVALDWRLVLHAWPHVVGNLVKHSSNSAALLRQCFTTDIASLARRVVQPTLVAWGGASRVMNPIAAHRLAEFIPVSRVIIAPGRTHAWVVSHPGEFAAAVTQFVQSMKLQT